jgi:hypothetical protein
MAVLSSLELTGFGVDDGTGAGDFGWETIGGGRVVGEETGRYRYDKEERGKERKKATTSVIWPRRVRVDRHWD